MMEIGVLRNDGIALLSKALVADLELCLRRSVGAGKLNVLKYKT